MIRIYIAGPFSAPTAAEIENNILAAEATMAEALRHPNFRQDISFIVPHSIGRNFKFGPGSPEYWYKATESMLLGCDGLLLVAGSAWRKSKGTRNEILLAEAHLMPVFHTVDQMIANCSYLHRKGR